MRNLLFPLGLFSALGLWIALAPFLMEDGRNQDFLNLYTGAELARSGNFAFLHDPVTQLAHERRIMPGRTTLVPFVRPHAYALLLAPLSWFDHKTAHIVWLVSQCALAALAIEWARRRFGRGALLWSVAFPGLALGTLLAQDPAVMLLTAAAGWALAERGKTRWAGFVFGLALFKFHLILGLAFGLAAARQWRILQGFSLSAALIAGLSLALGGIDGATRYWSLLNNHQLEGLSPSPELMTNLQALAANFNSDALYLLALRSGQLWRTYAASMAAGLWLTPHVYAYDGAILLPSLLLAFYESKNRWMRWAAACYLAPVALWFNSAGKPFAAANSICLFVFLAALGLTAKRPEN